jgi:hypothetical protein
VIGAGFSVRRTLELAPADLADALVAATFTGIRA